MSSTNAPVERIEPTDIQPFVIRQALTGLELSDADQHLIQYLDFFAERFPVAAAYFLHVAPRFDLLLDSDILHNKYQLDDAILERLAETVTAKLSKDRIATVDQELREGNPLEELLRDAKKRDADLVVIGQKSLAESHGILAKKLARRLECNALIVPTAAKRRLSKVLVPIDFSAHAVKALQTAVAMNRQLADPVEIVCLNVYEMPDFAAFNIGKTEEQFRNMIENDRREALAAFVETHAPEEEFPRITQKIQLKARPGVARYLMDYARAMDVDLIVMGARGHSRIHLLFIGSVTETMLAENKEIPTLIVR